MIGGMLRILGRPNSYNTQKVLWLLEEMGTKFELELYGLEHGGNHTPEYHTLNPNELVRSCVISPPDTAMENSIRPIPARARPATNGSTGR
jgi:hypothetical protein